MFRDFKPDHICYADMIDMSNIYKVVVMGEAVVVSMLGISCIMKVYSYILYILNQIIRKIKIELKIEKI